MTTTIQQLIDRLESLKLEVGGACRTMVPGYEGGIDDVEIVKIGSCILDDHDVHGDGLYFGKHMFPIVEDEKRQPTIVVLIFGRHGDRDE